jgi:hypothetical protein
MFLAAGLMCHRGMTGSGEKAKWLCAYTGFLLEPAVFWAAVLSGSFCEKAGAEAPEPVESAELAPVLSLSVVWPAGAGSAAGAVDAVGLAATGGGACGALAAFAVPATERPRSAFETWMPICAALCVPFPGGSGMLACAAGDMAALGSENSCMPRAAIAGAAALASGGVEVTEMPVMAEVMVAPNRYAPFAGQG